MKMIFIVDDNDTNLIIAERALENHYNVMTMPSAEIMFSLMEKIMPDLILMDIQMPGMNGLEALSLLKSDKTNARIPVILLTSLHDAAIEAHGFELGALDFISKPFSPPVLLNRIKTHLNINELIIERTAQLDRLQSGIVLVLADIVENRDRSTGGHIERVTVYIHIMIDAMLEHGIYSDQISGWDLKLVISSSRLHDVGKITISDFILNKPGSLTNEEFETIKTHAIEGEHIINQIISRTGEVEFLSNAKLFAGYHHENWDGTGYPHGLKGTDIPLLGRIMAVVDVYDALVSSRPYKKAFTDEEAFEIIRAGSGKRFDPQIVDVFCDVKEKFIAAKTKFLEKALTGAATGSYQELQA